MCFSFVTALQGATKTELLELTILPSRFRCFEALNIARPTWDYLEPGPSTPVMGTYNLQMVHLHVKVNKL